MLTFHFNVLFMKNDTTVRIDKNTLKKLIFYSTLYGYLRNQTEDSIQSMSANAPYVVQGPAENWISGNALDDMLVKELGGIDAQMLDDLMHDMIETDFFGNPT